MILRLQKVIADCGITSRRKAENMILDGRVAVNGAVVTEMGCKVDPAVDVIEVDGRIIDLDAITKEYIILHKPRGFVTTTSDPEGRKTIMDLIPMVQSRVYPVGRLDYLSEGLIILTNDGELANMVMHPRYEITKVYEVKVFGHVNEALLRKLKAGIDTEEGKLKPKSVRILKFLENKTWLEFRLGEGKNREIRRICEGCGLTVDKLKRVAIENLTITGIAPGNHTVMTRDQLLKALNLNADGSKRARAKEFISAKKTVKVPKIFHGKHKLADSENFHQYRKDAYLKTMAFQKKMKTEGEMFTMDSAE